jgi:hypothetical protein
LGVYNLFNHPQAMTVNNTTRFEPAGNQVNAQFGTVTAACKGLCASHF